MPKQTRVSRTKMFHFKVDITRDDEIETKYYFTKKQITEEHGISSMTIHRAMTNPNHQMRDKFKHLRITKIYEPARTTIPLSCPVSASPKASVLVEAEE